jgi:hypothetical protein
MPSPHQLVVHPVGVLGVGCCFSEIEKLIDEGARGGNTSKCERGQQKIKDNFSQPSDPIGREVKSDRRFTL